MFSSEAKHRRANKLDSMKPETIGELNIFFSGLSEKLDAHMESSQKGYQSLMQGMEKLEKTCELTLQQALKTNGRVNIIEPLALDYQEKRARVRGAVWVITLVGLSFVTVGGFALNSYLNYKTAEITDGVVKQLETKYNIDYSK